MRGLKQILIKGVLYDYRIFTYCSTNNFIAPILIYQVFKGFKGYRYLIYYISGSEAELLADFPAAPE